MDFALDQTQQILKTSARDFLSKECPTALVREMRADKRGYPEELWAKMADLGWLGLAVPEKYGGSGASFFELCVLMEEMGRAVMPAPFVSQELSIMMLLEAGSEEQKEKLLPGMVNGKMLVMPAFYESGFNDPSTKVKTAAVAKGDGYVIEGEKALVPWAHLAEKLLIVAHIGSSSNKNVFLVDAKAAGVTAVPVETVSGDKLFSVKLKGVKVGKDALLSGKGSKGEWLTSIMQKGALMRCAEMSGGAERALEITIEYTKVRVQFDQLIGKFQAIQHHVANIAVDLATLKLTAQQAAWLMSEGLECTQEASMAKSWVGDAYRRILMLAHQVNGGVGLVEDHDLTLYTRRSFGAISEFGGPDYHREIVAQKIGL